MPWKVLTIVKASLFDIGKTMTAFELKLCVTKIICYLQRSDMEIFQVNQCRLFFWCLQWLPNRRFYLYCQACHHWNWCILLLPCVVVFLCTTCFVVIAWHVPWFLWLSSEDIGKLQWLLVPAIHWSGYFWWLQSMLMLVARISIDDKTWLGPVLLTCGWYYWQWIQSIWVIWSLAKVEDFGIFNSSGNPQDFPGI